MHLCRHRSTPASHARFFKGIDDGARCAVPGIVWKLDDKNMEIVTVVCLGYVHDDPRHKSGKTTKSAKVSDRRATEVIMRPAMHIGKKLAQSQLVRVTALELFRQGTPHDSVDVQMQAAEEKRILQYIDRIEDRDRGSCWIKVKPFFAVTPLEMNEADVDAAVKQDNSRRASERRARMRATAKSLRASEDQKKKDLALKKAKEKRAADNELQRRRRAVNRSIDRKIAAVQKELMANFRASIASQMKSVRSDILEKADESVERMRENLEDSLQEKIHIYNSKKKKGRVFRRPHSRQKLQCKTQSRRTHLPL